MKYCGFILACSLACIMLFSSTAIAEKKVMPRMVENVSEIAKCARIEARHAHGHSHLHACRNHHSFCKSNIWRGENSCGIIHEQCENVHKWLSELSKKLKHCKKIKL